MTHALAQFFAHAWGRCFFDNFLVATLEGAVPFEEVYGVVVLVAEYLNFNVAGLLEVFFDQHDVVVKAVFSFAFSGG